MDQPIFDANSKMKTIVTNIISSSGEVVKAMTYFEPEGGFNTWYPTIIIQMKSQIGKDLEAMIEAKRFSGTIEFKTTDNVSMNVIQFVNNEKIVQVNNVEFLSKSTKSSGISKIMLVDESGGGLPDCLKAADVCATNSVKDMGAISLALCVIELPICLAAVYADCFLHEKECIGIKKPLAV